MKILRDKFCPVTEYIRHSRFMKIDWKFVVTRLSLATTCHNQFVHCLFIWVMIDYSFYFRLFGFNIEYSPIIIKLQMNKNYPKWTNKAIRIKCAKILGIKTSTNSKGIYIFIHFSHFPFLFSFRFLIIIYNE
jgi:hypothetical protein